MPTKLVRVSPIQPFDWRWPEGPPEHFEPAWDLLTQMDGRQVRVRYGLAHRPAYGRIRLRSVAWVGGFPTVEGVEADDYARSRSLLSVIKPDGRHHARTQADLPSGYEGFVIVRHSDEIQALGSRRSLAVKIAEDDFERWTSHAIIRALALKRI